MHAVSRYLSLPAALAPPLNTYFLDRAFNGCEAILLLQLALQCGLFDLIDEDARTPEEAAAAMGVDAKKTGALLDALTALGCLKKVGGSYRLSPASALFLRRKGSHNIAELLQARFSRLKLLQQAGCRLLEPTSAEEKKEPSAAETVRFTRNMAQSAVSSGSIRTVVRQITSDPAFKQARRMLDLGCSHGFYTAALCLLNRDLRAVLFDRPAVVPLTRSYLERFRLGGQVEYRGGDLYTDQLGGGYDLILAANVFYRSPDLILPVLKKIRHSLKPGGLLYLWHRYLDRSRTSPAPAVFYYCTRVLRMPYFHVATLHETAAGLQQAGLTLTAVYRSRRTGNALLRAQRAPL